ncbi:unnamed protein product [Adineta ricciae]|uniref:Meckel syndrome type 1 protein n=1 Tax=Adineta ricciae TaxID=249248 RepID=A0A815KL90_ADIRI|nr:unnamed protein product [Adineta ricciae]CAF1397733.1 unnamed protein product [Adineta ricciae]
MSSLDDNDVNYAVYRSKDQIQNFKIRVKLEHLTSNALIPSLSRLKIQEDLLALLDSDGQKVKQPKATATDVLQALNAQSTTDYEEVVISWQQKLFSRLEFEAYGRDMGSSSTPLEKIYFDQIQKMKAKRQQPGRIFTYIQDDPYCMERDLDYFMTDSPNEQPSNLALGLNSIRKRRTIPSRSNNQNLPKADLIKENLTTDDLLINRYGSFPHQTMYIMVDLNDPVDTSAAQLVTFARPPNEHVLCRIHVHSNEIIIITPDFNPGKVAYIIETGYLSNEVYQYYLEHASTSISKTDLVKERKLYNEICLRQHEHLAQLVGSKFDVPPPTVLKLNIIGEIVSARNFEYDHIYVYYVLDLAEDWHVESSTLLSGYTHTGSTTMSSKHIVDDVVYYSHPFEFELWYKPSSYGADRSFPRMPKIYFQVASLDSWGRHRTEGYTYTDIPNIPGFYDEHLSCWRPRGDSIFNEVRRFFIGGSLELEDISYIAIPTLFRSEPSNSLLSRFGFRTISTGSINIRFNVVFQSQSFAMEHKKTRRVHAANRYGFDAFMSNVHSVLEEFERAKRRAIEVRQNVAETINSSF